MYTLVCNFRDVRYLWPAFCTNCKLTPFFSHYFFHSLIFQRIILRTGSLVWGIEDESLHPIRSNFFSDEIYLGHSAAIPGKLSYHLATWPPKKQPWCSQKTSIQELQTAFDESNWQHLSRSPIQCLHCRQRHKHLRLKINVVRCNIFNSSSKPQKIIDSF